MPIINGTKQLGDFEYQKFREDSEGKPAIAVVNPDGSNIGGGSSSPDTPLSIYTYIQKDLTNGTYKYYGYADANTAGAWAIKRVTRSTNLAEFIKGTTDYSTNWTGRAGLSYTDIWSTF